MAANPDEEQFLAVLDVCVTRAIHVPEAFFFAANWQDIVNVLFTGVAIWSIFR